MLVPTPTPADYARAKEASDAVVSQLRQLVEAKHDAPGDDLVSALIAARDGDERLDNQELLSTIFQLIVAGHDTTTTFIGNAVVALLDHPEQLELLRGDPDRIPAAVEELLRYDAPVPHSTFRYAVESVEIGGHSIPAGAQVIVCLAAANRDRCRFAEPERLDMAAGRRASPGVRARHPPLPRRSAGPPRGPAGARIAHPAFPPAPPRRRACRTCTGATATGSCCAACPSCRSFPVPPGPGSTSTRPGTPCPAGAHHPALVDYLLALGQDLDVALRAVDADLLSISDQPGGPLYAHDGR